MPQQPSGRGRGHWDQEEVRRRAMSPSDFPWGRGNVNPVPSEGGVSGRLPLSRVSSTEGQPRRQPSPALAGRDPSGAVQQGPEKYPVRKGGVKTLREGRQSKSGPRGRAAKFSQIGQDGPGQPSPSFLVTGVHSQFSSSSKPAPPSIIIQRAHTGHPSLKLGGQHKIYQRELGSLGRGRAKFRVGKTGRGRPS